MTTAPQPPPPTHLGRYEIVRELGRGAMGVVYEAFDPVIKRRVAIKTARRDVFTQAGQAEEMMTRFIREAQAAGALNHPNIITIHDTGDHEGISFIVMEFIEGGSLHEQLRAGQRWDPVDVAAIGATLADALAAAHERGIVHRDIKPANIMAPTRGPVKIADFGIAHTSDSTLTRQGDMIGTPYYMSPEQFMGQKVDARSDLFSLAIILYEMLTGERPFRGQAINTVMHECLKAVPTPPQELNFAVPPCLGGVLLKALEKSPLHRYQNGTAFAEALRECVKEAPNPAITKVTPNDATVIAGAAAETIPPAQGTQKKIDLEATDVREKIDAPPHHKQGETSSLASKTNNKKSPFVIVGVVTTLVCVAAAAMLLRLNNGSNGAAPDGSVTQSANYFGRVNIWTFLISTQECYNASELSTGEAPCAGIDNPAPDVPIKVTIANAQDPSQFITLNVEDEDSEDLSRYRWSKIVVTFELTGYNGPGELTYAADEPNHQETIRGKLVKEGIVTTDLTPPLPIPGRDQGE